MQPDRSVVKKDDDAVLASLEKGLDALDPAVVEKGSVWRRQAGKILPPLIAVVLVVLVWQILIWMEIEPRYTFPSPLDVLGALREQWSSAGLAQGAVGGAVRGVRCWRPEDGGAG